MHSLLEGYLKEVAGYLAGLPAARRAEELREMRTHLENAVIVGQEMGRTEDEAVREALAQFGTPSETGGNLVQVWRRERTLNRRSLLGAAACTAAVLFLMSFFVMKVLLESSLGHSMSHAQETAFQWESVVCFSLIVPVPAGIASAVFFSRKAVPGVVLGQTVFHCFCWGYLAVQIAAVAHSACPSPSFFVGLIYNFVGAVSATVFAAWAVSRLRIAGQRQRYQAVKYVEEPRG